jgi:hypothetical protein
MTRIKCYVFRLVASRSDVASREEGAVCVCGSHTFVTRVNAALNIVSIEIVMTVEAFNRGWMAGLLIFGGSDFKH